MPLGVADLVLTRSATEDPLGGAAFSLAFSRVVLGALGGGLFGGGPFGGVGPATRARLIYYPHEVVTLFFASAR